MIRAFSKISKQFMKPQMLATFAAGIRLPWQQDLQTEMDRIASMLYQKDSMNRGGLVKTLRKGGYDKNLCFEDDQVTVEKQTLGDHRDHGHAITLTRGDETLSGVHFGNIFISQNHWDALKGRFDKEMKHWDRALAKYPDHPLPTNLDEVHAFSDLGLSKRKAAKKQAQEDEIQRELTKLGDKIKTAVDNGNGPKRIIIYSDGPDAVGKSSTGAVVISALEKAGFRSRIQIFKLPIPNQHWLKRFIDFGIPEEGEVVFWDRGPAGDIVYGGHSDKMNWAMGVETNGFEARLAAKGILLVKMQIYAQRTKQCKVFGKRLAREVIAQGILDDNPDLTQEEKDDLGLVAVKVDGDDYRSFESYQSIEDRFMNFALATQVVSNWMIEDSTDRHACRLRLIEDFNQRINLKHKSWAYHNSYHFKK